MNIEEKLLDFHEQSRCGRKIGKITKIVVHWVGNANSTAIANRNYFNKHERYASSHYIIGLQGEIILCIPEKEIAWHGNNENNNSIGIECCHPDWNGKFNDKTYSSLIELCTDLCKRYKLNPLTDIIRHYDCRGANHKDCPHYYVKNINAWNKLKQDVNNALKGDKTQLKSNIISDEQLGKVVSDIIKSGVNLTYDNWKRYDRINPRNAKYLLDALKGVDNLIKLGVISNKKLWTEDINNVTKENLVSLLVKYHKIVMLNKK